MSGKGWGLGCLWGVSAGEGHDWTRGGWARLGGGRLRGIWVPASASEGPQYLIPVCKQLVWGRARPADGGLSR